MTSPATGSPGAEPARGKPSAAGAGLNLKQVARRLGVHYMTAYRYVRQGRLSATQEGATWLVSERDLERFEHEESGKQAGGAGAVDWADRLYRCLLAGDEASSWRVVRAALGSGHAVSFCYVEMLSAALVTLGAQWEAGEVTVADQYLATAVAGRIVARLGALSRRPGRDRGTVVFGAPSGELHGLPVSIAADLVRCAGFAVLELGADAPPEAFALAARRAPRLVAVGVGMTSPDRTCAAQEVIDALRAADPEVPIVIGGQAAISAAGSVLRGVTAWATDGPAAVAVIEELAKKRARRARHSASGSPSNETDPTAKAGV